MASVVYQTTPSTEPAGPGSIPGGGLQRIQSSPESFGALPAAATQRLGGTLNQVGSELFEAYRERTTMQNAIVADDYMTRFNNDADALLYTGNDALFKKQGEDYTRAHDKTLADLQALRDQYSGVLNPAQRLRFNSETRGYLQRETRVMGARYDAELKRYGIDTNKAGADLDLRRIASDPGNEQTFDQYRESLRKRFVKDAELKGLSGSPEAYEDAVVKADAAAWKQRIDAQVRVDPFAAEKSLQAAPPGIFTGPELMGYQRSIEASKNHFGRQLVETVANEAVGMPPGKAQHSAPDDLWGVIKRKEGGVAPDGSARVSSAGAVGVSQILPSTARLVSAELGEPYDEGRLHTDRAYNERLGRRYLDDMLTRYDGNQTLASAAYNAGPARVDQWIGQFGDPRTGAISDAEFAKKIPIPETRNYVTDIPGRPALPRAARGPVAGAMAESLSGSLDYIDRQVEAGRLSPDLGEASKALVETKWRRHVAEQARLEAVDAREKRQRSEQAADRYVKALIKDPTSVSLTAIADDPDLTHEQREHFWKVLDGARVQGDSHDVKTYGTGFYDLYRRVHAPPGDPDRIVDPTQLYGHVGPNGDLTVSGVDKLTQEIMGKRTPEGEAEAEMRRQFFKTAHAAISGHDDVMKIRDQKGEELFLKFMAHALPAIEAGKAAGKTPAQLLNPESSDYVGKLVEQYRRPFAQRIADMISEAGEYAGTQKPETPAGASIGQRVGDALSGVSTMGLPRMFGGEETPAPDLKSEAGIVAAYRAGKINREAAAKALQEGGFATGSVSPAAVPPLR